MNKLCIFTLPFVYHLFTVFFFFFFAYYLVTGFNVCRLQYATINIQDVKIFI
jgi:hypothetical protein